MSWKGPSDPDQSDSVALWSHRASSVSALCSQGTEQHRGRVSAEAPPAGGGEAGTKRAFAGCLAAQTVLFGEENPPHQHSDGLKAEPAFFREGEWPWRGAGWHWDSRAGLGATKHPADKEPSARSPAVGLCSGPDCYPALCYTIWVAPRFSAWCKQPLGAQGPLAAVPALHGVTEAGLAAAPSRFAVCCFHSAGRREPLPPAGAS